MGNLVSVVIPAYNAEAYVLKAVESILNQTYTNLEIVITDDCSKDKTYQILQSIKDNRIKLYRNEENAGVSYTLNHCIKNSSGNLIAVMHADDIAHPDRIKVQAEFFKVQPDIAIIGSQCYNIDDTDKVLDIFRVDTDPYEILLNVFLKKIPFLHPSVMYRREAVLKVNLYNSAYDGMEDHDIWLRFAAAGYKFGNILESMLQYRRHTTQISQNYSAADIEKNYAIFYDFVVSLGVKRSHKEVVQYCNICNNYFTSSPKEFKFFLRFFSDLLQNYRFLSDREKKLLKKKLLKKIIKSKSKKKLSSYIDVIHLLKWY